MSKEKDNNHVSFWFWMFALFVTALPCIGAIMVLVWAFVGDNSTRKNYFRALIAWFLIIAVLWTGIMAFGLWPQIQKQVQTWMPQAR
jgi:hypothetical protein